MLAIVALVSVACSGQPKVDNNAAPDSGQPSTIPSSTASPHGTSTASPKSTNRGTRNQPSHQFRVHNRGHKDITVTVPDKPGGVPEANLYSGATAKQGITDSKITLCSHAGISLAATTGNNADQLTKTYWRMVNEDQGGIYGRQVDFTIEDDGYSPTTTPRAFTACQDKKPALMIGGIGFDQTPTFRSLAEQNKELYVYGLANEDGVSNATYSFAAAPSVERMSRKFAQTILHFAHGKKIGVLTVSSAGWKLGAIAFKAELKRLGYSADVPTEEIANNNDVLTSHVVNLKNAGVGVVFLNINTLAWTRFTEEADGQGWNSVTMVGYGFNFLTDKAGDKMQKFPDSIALSIWPVYDPATHYGWAAEYARMRFYYKKYWNAEPNDIDWITWVSLKGFHRLLLDCGKECNRNKIAGLLLAGYRKTEPPTCETNYGRDPRRHAGGYLANVWRSQDRGTSQYWKQINTCIEGF